MVCSHILSANIHRQPFHRQPFQAFLPIPPLPHPRPVLTKPLLRCSLSEILILGGTGRVGTALARSLIRSNPPPNITLAARTIPLHHPLHHVVSFTPIDITNEPQLQTLLPHYQIIVHCAGPFQNSPHPTLVLRIAAKNRIPYIDISDDVEHSLACKRVNVTSPALISTGIYPGLSNLLVRKALCYARNPEEIKIYYHTAGSGGIGATVLVSTFLLLAQQALAYTPEESYFAPGSAAEMFDFGPDIGERNTFYLNLPEVASLHEYLAPDASISAKFSTAPPLWNVLLQLMARLPKAILTNVPLMTALAKVSIPVVRAVDRISGARTAISVVVDDVRVEVQYEHLAEAVGDATAAFVRCVEHVPPGVWFPEQLSERVVDTIIEDAVQGADIYQITKAGQAVK